MRRDDRFYSLAVIVDIVTDANCGTNVQHGREARCCSVEEMDAADLVAFTIEHLREEQALPRLWFALTINREEPAQRSCSL